MNRAEWQKFYNFTDDDMNRIDSLVKIFSVKIVEIFNFTWKDFRK